MKWWLWIPVALVALAVATWIIGASLPREHSATCVARFKASPRGLYDSIADVAGAQSWRKELSKVELLPPRDGKITWREESSWGKVDYLREIDEPGERVVVRIVSDDLPYGGTWTYRLEPDGAGTKLSITEDGFVKPAFFRFMARFVFGYHATMEGSLKALGAKHGEAVVPERI